eukprot:TRINITY_DN83316_c0_g1_i1.p1 TRINITY_DN83316_c0_g1~~TRINITY_DN83316_c0_g1_i1.p1  ORF type:complete len:310 (-),score=71.50 TRINITY_DN83316_c0_g1_i1:24-953(-)
MGVEHHTYGVLCCGFVTRRHFIVYFCAAAALMSYVQLGVFIYDFYAIGGIEVAANLEAASCQGLQCQEVWSCHGFKDATEHLREPFLQAVGALSFSLGFFGALNGDRWQLQVAYMGMLTIGVCATIMVVFDYSFTQMCGLYPTSAVDGLLLRRVPPSPLRGGMQQQLRATAKYPVDLVDRITNGFNTILWHSFYMGMWGLFNLYASHQAKLLAQLVEQGPLGLGVNFGLHQWDEVINHDILRQHRMRLHKSQFVDDAQQPLPLIGVKADSYGAARGFPYKAAEGAYMPHYQEPVYGGPLQRGGGSMLVL